MRDYSRAVHNAQMGLSILSDVFGDPVDQEALCSHMARDLAPYVPNVANLRTAIAMGSHLSEYATFLIIKSDGHDFAAFNGLCRLWLHARSTHPLEFAESFKSFYRPKRKAIRDYSDLFHLERPKKSVADDLSVKMAFTEVGQIIEGCIQPFARHFLHLQLLKTPCTLTTSLSGIAGMSLGDVIAGLGRTPALASLYSPPPWGLSLSQWRNIAQHCSYEYSQETEFVTCHYGKSPRLKMIEFPYPQIHDLCKCVNWVYGIHKTAESILNLGVPELSSALEKQSDVTPSSFVSCITEVLHTNSLNVISINLDATPWELIALDPLDRNESQLQPLLNQVAQFTGVLKDCQILFVIKEQGTGRIHTGLIGRGPIG
ncbi:MAG: hypothetical protein PHD01_14450 [Geobacteraceae bacterium]|nr:hypothetical protein [Geobacteraceae bacterium]